MYSYSRHLIDRTSSAPCLTSFSEMRFLSLPSVVFQRVLTYSSTGGTLIQRASLNRFLAGIGDGGLMPFMINMTEIDLISYDL